MKMLWLIAGFLNFHFWACVNAFLTVHGRCQVDANLLFFQCHIGTMIPTLCAMRAPLGRDMLLGGLPALR